MMSNINCVPLVIKVTGGTGTLAGVTGSMVVSACFEEDGVTFVAWLSGFLVLSDFDQN